MKNSLKPVCLHTDAEIQAAAVHQLLTLLLLLQPKSPFTLDAASKLCY